MAVFVAFIFYCILGSADHDYNSVIELEGADRLSERLISKVMQDSSITSGVHLSRCVLPQVFISLCVYYLRCSYLQVCVT